MLRAKIDLETQNMNLRDPVLYRIRYAAHHRTGKQWCIYPMYDYAHPLSDAIEEITHSICTLEFESHRPLYDWCIKEAEVFPSRQIEFARLNLTYTVMSKRKLAELVQKKLVSGWDDPRMPTLAGLRRRGYTPEAIRAFCERIGVAKTDSIIDVGLLEHGLRDDLNRRSPRVMAVLRPLKLVIDNFPEGEVRELEAPLHPEDAAQGTRKLPFSRVVYVDRDDFREDPPKDWFRLAPGREVRLRYACLVTCTRVVKDASGEVTELHATWDPGVVGRQRARRAHGARHPALGVGGARGARRGAALRSPVRRREPGHRRGQELPRRDQPRLDRAGRGRGDGAVPGVVGEAGDARAVRARRLLLPRPRQRAGQADLEPDGRAEGQLGEDRGQGGNKPGKQGEAQPSPQPSPKGRGSKECPRRPPPARRSPSTISARSICASGS